MVQPEGLLRLEDESAALRRDEAAAEQRRLEEEAAAERRRQEAEAAEARRLQEEAIERRRLEVEEAERWRAEEAAAEQRRAEEEEAQRVAAEAARALAEEKAALEREFEQGKARWLAQVAEVNASQDACKQQFSRSHDASLGIKRAVEQARVASRQEEAVASERLAGWKAAALATATAVRCGTVWYGCDPTPLLAPIPPPAFTP